MILLKPADSDVNKVFNIHNHVVGCLINNGVGKINCRSGDRRKSQIRMFFFGRFKRQT